MALLRKKRVELLLDTVKENPTLPLNKIVAKFMFETGLTRKRVTEYLHLLENEKKIKIESDKVVLL